MASEIYNMYKSENLDEGGPRKVLKGGPRKDNFLTDFLNHFKIQKHDT